MRYIITSALLLAFFVIIITLLPNEAVKGWDTATFRAMNTSHGKVVDELMFVFSAYGREVVWTLVVIVLFLFGKGDERKIGLLLVVAFLILIPTGTILKDEIKRPRPVPVFDQMLIKLDHSDPSFPSGHALITSGGACVLLTQYMAGKRKIFSVALTSEAAVVCFSLVDVGAHYPLDVIGGILLGFGIGLAVVSSKKYLEFVFSYVKSMKRKNDHKSDL